MNAPTSGQDTFCRNLSPIPPGQPSLFMHKLIRVIVTGIIVLSGAQHRTAIRAQRPGSQPRAMPGELIVKFRSTAAPADKVRARGRVAGARLAELARTPRALASGSIELLRISTATTLEAAIAQVQRDPAVEYAEPNWIYQHAAAPNDPTFPHQWALQNTGQAVSGERGTPDADIDAVQAWQTTPSAAGVYIGLLDEGIDLNHPDLGVQPGGAIWTNPFDPLDGIDNDGNGYVDDLHGWDFLSGDNTIYDGSAAAPSVDAHGTHVAGIMAARTGNGRGIAGVSPGVTLIPTKFLGTTGGTTTSAVLAIDYLIDLKVRHGLNIIAINNSWTGGGYSQSLLDAITRAARQDILFIAAAGNGGADDLADDNDVVPNYPSRYNTAATAGYDAVISVTASGLSDELTSWSNYGMASVDLSAPGVLIASTAPQDAYWYLNGSSMAAPHVSGAAALVHAARGLTGYGLREAILSTVDPMAGLNARTATGGRLNLARAVNPGGSVDPTPAEIVLYAARARTAGSHWSVVTDSTAAGGSRLQSGNAGAPKLTSPLASPPSYFEIDFEAQAKRPYRLWLRGKALNNGWANDSVFVQFDGTIGPGQTPVYRIGTTSATEINLEACHGCGLAGWGWQDNGYGTGVLGPVITFNTSGPQRLRVQVREDGLGIDQIVLSPDRFLTTAPGPAKNDQTILATPSASEPWPSMTDEIVMYAADAPVVAGRWFVKADTTAAGGTRLQNPNAAAPRIVTAAANPADYFELTFHAEALQGYRLWMRSRAENNGWANDSVHVQFSDSVDANGTPVYRIGTTTSAEVNLEECSGCGLSGWGWQDNGYGAGVAGPEIRFATTGTHTVRVQVREDGLGIDQIVLSRARHQVAAPGRVKNDATILLRSGQ
jgi:subtilisin family serine protease